MHLIRKKRIVRAGQALRTKPLTGGLSVPESMPAWFKRQYGGLCYSGVVGLFTNKSWSQALPSLEETAWGLYRSP
jgi:hypothetical protein